MTGFLRKAVLALLASALLSACSSSGEYKVKQAFIEPINSTKSVSIMVTADKSKGSKEDNIDVAPALQEKLFSTLVARGVFKSAVMHPNKADYNLEVNILDAKIVSNAARLLLGIMAGPSYVEAEVLLKDAASDKLLTAFDVQGTSATHPMSSETGYENAVRETATNIANALKANSR